MIGRPEPVQLVKQRRDGALRALAEGIPYSNHLGVRFERRGDELTGLLPFDEKLIGNPMLPALHGGVTAAFLEVCAVIQLSWSYLWDDIEFGPHRCGGIDAGDASPPAQDDRFHGGLPAHGPAARCLCAGAGEPVGASLCLRACGGMAGQSQPPLRAGDRAFPDAALRWLGHRSGR